MSTQPANDNVELSDDIIARLKELNTLDIEIAFARRDLDKRPRDLAARQRQIDEQEKVVQLAKDTVTAAQKRIDKKTMEIDALAQDVLKLEGQLFSLKSNDEFNAMKSQIAARRKKDDDLQTEVLELYDVLEGLKEEHEKTVARLNDLKDAYRTAEGKVEADLREAAAGVESMEARRAECLEALPEAVRTAYDAAFARRGQGTALVIDQICKGCDTQITLQTLSQVMGHKLVPCRNCQRILVIGE